MFNKSNGRVKWRNEFRKPIKSKYGVLQGGVLSPKLFTEFLCDISEYLDSSLGVKLGGMVIIYLLFADDIVLFSDTAEGLQKQISLFWDYCRLWQLIVSLPKSKVVIYNKWYANETYDFNIGGDRLEICESYKYLGLWCSNSHNMFSKNYTYLSVQAEKTLYAIKSYTTLGKLHPNLALKLALFVFLHQACFSDRRDVFSWSQFALYHCIVFQSHTLE